MNGKGQFEVWNEEELYERTVDGWDVFVTKEGNGYAVFGTETKSARTFILSFSQDRDRAIEFATIVNPKEAGKLVVLSIQGRAQAGPKAGAQAGEVSMGCDTAAAPPLTRRFKKKPIVVQAVQWRGKNLREVIDFTGLHESARKWTWEVYERVVEDEGLKVFTNGEPHVASIGDWIVERGRGDHIVYNQDLFESVYEMIDSGIRA